MEQIDTYFEQLIELSIAYAPRLVLAIIVLIVGFWVANKVTKIILMGLDKASTNNSKELQGFLSSIVRIGLKVLVVISVAGIVGIETTSFVGIIAAMGFAVGLALQGNLSNFAAGVMILLIRPFKVGDEVKIQGYWAYVKKIQIFHTVLENFDETEAIIPNSMIMSGTIDNLSATPTRSITIVMRIPFGEDFDKVIRLVKEAAYSVPEVDKEAKPFIWILDFEPYNMHVSAGFPAKQEGFWDTDYEVRKRVIETFAKNNVKVVYPEGATFGEFGKWDPKEGRDMPDVPKALS